MGIYKHEAKTRVDRLIEAVEELRAAIHSLSDRVGPKIGPNTQAVPIKQEHEK